MNKKTILVVAAHPDDEILGCGGTIAKLSKTCTVYSLVLGEGITARDPKRLPSKRKSALSSLYKDLLRANKMLGVQNVFTTDLPDNRFDSVALLDITKTVEGFIEKLQPHTIYTHFGNDLNIDHQITYNAVVTATRPLVGQIVQEVYAFETISSTEFNYPLSFGPDTFSDITEFLEVKLKALAEYKGEMRPFPHPRSLEFVKQVAHYWGTRVGLGYAEAFQTVRKLW